MKIRPLLIDNGIREQAKRVIQYAETNRLTLRDLLNIIGEPGRSVGDDKNRLLEIPFGYRVCFSIEQQEKGWTRHISISVNERGKWPNEHAVMEIVRLFGFQKPKREWFTYLEKGDFEAVNIVEMMQ